MPWCPRYPCVSVAGHTHTFDNIDRGHVIAINASIHQPMAEIIGKSNIVEMREKYQRKGATLSSISKATQSSKNTRTSTVQSQTQASGNTVLKSRPAIVVSNPMDNKGKARVCLMATFEGTPLNELPELLQQFCMPVYPDKPPGVDENYHFHTSPEWRGGGHVQWVILWPFYPPYRIVGSSVDHWTDNRSPGRTHFSVDLKNLNYITGESQRKWQQWKKSSKIDMLEQVTKYEVCVQLENWTASSHNYFAGLAERKGSQRAKRARDCGTCYSNAGRRAVSARK